MDGRANGPGENTGCSTPQGIDIFHQRVSTARTSDYFSPRLKNGPSARSENRSANRPPNSTGATDSPNSHERRRSRRSAKNLENTVVPKGVCAEWRARACRRTGDVWTRQNTAVASHRSPDKTAVLNRYVQTTRPALFTRSLIFVVRGPWRDRRRFVIGLMSIARAIRTTRHEYDNDNASVPPHKNRI